MLTIEYIRENKLLLFECISGSRAYGLATPQSDTDIKGVFVLPLEQYYGFEYIPQVSNETNDIVFYELKRFLELLACNNPNLLEMLFTDDEFIITKHPLFEAVQPALFLSKLCKDTFANYAINQIKRARGLKKKIVNPQDKIKKSVLDFCYVIDGARSLPLHAWLSQREYLPEHCGLVNIAHMKDIYALFYNPDPLSQFQGICKNAHSQDVSLSSVPKGLSPAAVMSFNKNAYSLYCKEYREYWEWVEKRNEVRYAGTMAHGKKYDAKNMMHTFRLLEIAAEIAQTGTFTTKRSNRDELLAIKSGQFNYEELLARADKLLAEIEILFSHSALPQAPDMKIINALLVDMRKNFYTVSL